MNALMLVMLAFLGIEDSQKSTFSLDPYKNAERYSYAEVSRNVGDRTYTLVNILPKFNTDTTCISAVIIDKRKFILHDIDVPREHSGLVVPARQPVSGGLIVLKLSPYDSKTFLFLDNGKIVTFPGSSVVIDTVGAMIYCVRDNEDQCQLTVFDYGRMRMVFQPREIKRPAQWFNDGIVYCFSVDGETDYNCIDMIMRSVTIQPSLDKNAEKVPYLLESGLLKSGECCSKAALNPNPGSEKIPK